MIKSYIGSTDNIDRRFKEHRKGSHNKELQKYIKQAETDTSINIVYNELERFEYCSIRGLKESAYI